MADKAEAAGLSEAEKRIEPAGRVEVADKAEAGDSTAAKELVEAGGNDHLGCWPCLENDVEVSLSRQTRARLMLSLQEARS